MPRPPFSSLDSPTDPYHKVNVDGSWKGSVAGVGFIIRNSRISLICSQTKCLTRQTPEEMEAEVVLTGMELALEHNLEHVDDSKLVMDAINDRGITGSWRIYPIVIAIHRIASLFRSITWKWSSRSANRAAHAGSLMLLV
ncbi:hypothetical protein ACFX2J_004447 [Malus domestica]